MLPNVCFFDGSALVTDLQIALFPVNGGTLILHTRRRPPRCVVRLRRLATYCHTFILFQLSPNETIKTLKATWTMPQKAYMRQKGAGQRNAHRHAANPQHDALCSPANQWQELLGFHLHSEDVLFSHKHAGSAFAACDAAQHPEKYGGAAG